MTITTCPPHHWLIEPAQGSTSKGRCQGCGEVRTFQNSYSYDPFHKEGAIERKPGPGRPKKEVAEARRKWNEGRRWGYGDR